MSEPELRWPCPTPSRYAQHFFLRRYAGLPGLPHAALGTTSVSRKIHLGFYVINPHQSRSNFNQVYNNVTSPNFGHIHGNSTPADKRVVL